MPTRDSKPALTGVIGAGGVFILAAVAFYVTIRPDLIPPDTLTRMRTTCGAALSQNPSTTPSLKGLTIDQACDCAVKVLYPALSEPTRKYVDDLYTRVEASAPQAFSARLAYDAGFPARLQAASQADQFSQFSAHLQLISEMNGLGTRDLGQCNALTR